MERRLPGGYGSRSGDDASGLEGESRYIREALIQKEGGWLISIVGDAVFPHYDVTGVTVAQDALKLYYLPELGRSVRVGEARINVAVAAASSTVELGIYRYDNRRFTRLPGTYAVIDSSTTGKKALQLNLEADILPSCRLFMAVLARGGAPVLEGFQSGAGATPRVVGQRTITNHSGPLHGLYALGETSLEVDNADTPMVAYLSKEASSVL